MRRLFAAILVVSLWISFAPVASAYNLVPCKDSPAFKELAKDARSTNGDPASAFMLSGFLWPLAALKEITTGEMFAKDDEITVSPR